ncbi:MAG: dockerin type I repeat-containing protein [Planctomycetota bacterium]|jgi:hypothetical protein
MRALLAAGAVLTLTTVSFGGNELPDSAREIALRVDREGNAWLVHKGYNNISYCEFHRRWDYGTRDPNRPVEIDSYEIWSLGSRLDPDGWRSIWDATEEAWEAFEAGDMTPLQLIVDSLGTGAFTWGEFYSMSNFLSEGSIVTPLSIQPGVVWSLGTPVKVPPWPSREDLFLYYTKPNFVGTKFPGVVEIWPILGDANADGLVDIKDFTILKHYLGTTPATWGQGNLNEDDIVDVRDFTILKHHLGEGTPPMGQVPEPTAALLLAAGALTVLSRYRRRLN